MKSEKGVITMVTLITVIFMISFLMSTYAIVANKVKTQKEIVAETKTIYEPKYTMEEIYNSYFSKEKTIPIYTVEQLLAMGSGQENVYVNGKYYNFTNDENTVYMLMNDLSFSVSDYEQNKIEDTGEYYWTPIGNRIAEYESLTDEELADEGIVSNYFQAKFEGKNNIIEVIYLDENNNEYSKEYSTGNNYSDITYIEETEDLLAGTWVFNDLIEWSGLSYDEYYLDFGYYNNISSIGVIFDSNGISFLQDGENEVNAYDNENGWNHDDFKEITITTKLNEMENGQEFLTWLQTNAVKQTAENLSEINETTYSNEISNELD